MTESEGFVPETPFHRSSEDWSFEVPVPNDCVLGSRVCAKLPDQVAHLHADHLGLKLKIEEDTFKLF